ncbi:unnamed protein product [Caenorhabditis brenneri]
MKCEERINGTVMFGLAYPKAHLKWIESVWNVRVDASNGDLSTNTTRKELGKGSTRLSNQTEDTEVIEMEEISYPTHEYMPKSIPTWWWKRNRPA